MVLRCLKNEETGKMDSKHLSVLSIYGHTMHLLSYTGILTIKNRNCLHETDVLINFLKYCYPIWPKNKLDTKFELKTIVDTSALKHFANVHV